MSRSVAKKVGDALGLLSPPCALQGRLGSAKGMWIIDVTDDKSGEDWIETYPSQRKWNCDFVDELQRTLEVRECAAELKSANLNFQLLPILEDRAVEKGHMRAAIGKLLQQRLQQEFDAQKAALEQPLSLYQWAFANCGSKTERLSQMSVPFLGGLPDNPEESLVFLLSGGFDPRKQKFLRDTAWNIQINKCNKLKEKLNVRVVRSAYVYMVVDFLGILEEDEVHLFPSTRFGDDEYSTNMLHGQDALVARSPAHYISDIQKVKLVYKPELQHLQNVVVFSSKGDVPLADKLSGGDYDGDQAWVCWDSEIVDNFVNADVPKLPDLFKSNFLRKVGGPMRDLVADHGHAAVSHMLVKSFAFNMAEKFLGRCTNYMERLCYKNGNVNDKAAVLLSTLVSHLVDQAKQGIEFTAEDWKHLVKTELRQPPTLPDPAYKSAKEYRGNATHIIDFLRFKIAEEAIDAELEAFDAALNPNRVAQKRALAVTAVGDSVQAEYWDLDLAAPYKHFSELAKDSISYTQLLNGLKRDVEKVRHLWPTSISSRKVGKSYTEKA